MMAGTFSQRHRKTENMRDDEIEMVCSVVMFKNT